MQLFAQGRTGSEFVAATANNFNFVVLWVCIRFHDCLLQFVRQLGPEFDRTVEGRE